jgi:type I site-specific restriction-modification system R (restriction) subunit
MYPKQADSGRHLVKLIEEKKANIITTVIHKFTTALRVRKFSEPDPNIFILVDESHHSQYGSFHPKMRQVFPKGCYLGFTGTPLIKKQKSTFKLLPRSISLGSSDIMGKNVQNVTFGRKPCAPTVGQISLT